MFCDREVVWKSLQIMLVTGDPTCIFHVYYTLLTAIRIIREHPIKIIIFYLIFFHLYLINFFIESI